MSQGGLQAVKHVDAWVETVFSPNVKYSRAGWLMLIHVVVTLNHSVNIIKTFHVIVSFSDVVLSS